jgi:hypothetical protein
MRSRKVLMIVETRVVVISGPLSSPLRARPRSHPVPLLSHEVGATNFYNDLWPLGGRKVVAVTNSRELLLLGHRVAP